jgi:hypothetical protein
MTPQFPHGADVAAVFQEVRRERVAEWDGGGPLGAPGLARRILYDTLEHGLAQTMPSPLAGLGVTGGPRGGTRPLPHPFTPSSGRLPGEHGGQFDPAGAALEVAHGHAVPVALASADHDLVPGAVDVLDAQAATFEQTQAGP